jgi:glycolate oxidase
MNRGLAILVRRPMALLGVTLVLMDGTVLELGGAHMDAGGLDLLGVVCGSEGQLGVVTEASLRILPKPEGARPVRQILERRGD